MKVLMLLSNPVNTDTRVIKEAESLIKAGYEVRLISWDRFRECNKKDSYKDIKTYNIHNNLTIKYFYALISLTVWNLLAFKKSIWLYHNDYKFDVVHSHDFDTLLASVLIKKFRNYSPLGS